MNQSTHSTSKQYDIIIVGGGMVGASFACALQQSNLKIALIDAAPLQIPDDPRLIALNHNSYCLFKNLNLWPMLSPHAEPIKEVHVSTQGQFGITRLNADELGFSVLGYLVPAKYINAALTSAIRNIDVYRPAKLTAINQDDRSATLIVQTESDQLILESPLVIAADGTHSTVRDLLAIQTQEFDYQQKALVTVTELQRDHKHIAYERFIPTGAIAMLPLAEKKVATIWTDNAATIDHLTQYPDEVFLEELQKQFGYRLGRLKSIQQRHTFPLKLTKVLNPVKDRVIFIGNAAHTIHPIAAQGLNLALYEIAILAEKLLQNPSLIREPLDAISLKQSTTLNLSHQLTQVFSMDFLPVNIARQLGMVGLDACLTAKKYFAKHAMGMANRLPALLLE